MLRHKAIITVLLLILSQFVCAQNAINYNDIPEEMPTSLDILGDKLDKEEPLLRKIEWQSFYTQAEKNTLLITAAIEQDKHEDWSAASWRDVTAKLIALLDKAEGILQQRLQDNELLLKSFSNQSNHPVLTTELQEKKQAVELTLQTTSAKLTQLRIIHQRLVNADKYFAKYQRKALNQTITKTDTFSIFDLDTYQTANQELQDYLKQIRRSKLLESGKASLVPLFIFWLGSWVWMFLSQYIFNRKHRQTLYPLATYSYKRVLLGSLRLLIRTVLLVIATAIFLVIYTLTQLDQVNLEAITLNLDQLSHETWLAFTALTCLLTIFGFLLTNLVRYLSSPKYRFFNMAPLSRHAINQLSLLALLIIFTQILDAITTGVISDGNLIMPGKAIAFLLNTLALLLTTALLFLSARKACWILVDNQAEAFKKNYPVALMQHSLFFIKVAALIAIVLIFIQRSSLANYIVSTIQFTIIAIFAFFLIKDFLRDFIYSLEGENSILASLEIKQETLRTILYPRHMKTRISCFHDSEVFSH